MTQPANPSEPRWQQPPPPTYQPPAMYPPPPPPPPPPPESQGKKILGMSLGIFLGIIGAAVLVCCIVPVGLLIFGGVLSGIEEANTPDPEVAIVSCEVDDSEILPTAEVEWEITNPGDDTENWTVTITVLDSEGRQIGDTYDGAFGIASGATVLSNVTVFLDASGGETCEISVND